MHEPDLPDPLQLPPIPQEPPPLPAPTDAATASTEVLVPETTLTEEEIVWPPPPQKDRWAHRRGEPRLFSLYWIAWLMLSSSMVLAKLGPRGLLDPAVSRPVTRSLFMMIAIGAIILWPMFRLSQAMPTKRPLAGLLLDVLIMFTTAQIVYWPQVLLAYWPMSAIGATSVSLLGWMLIAAGVLSIVMERQRRIEIVFGEKNIAVQRGLGMVVCLVIALGGLILPACFGWTAEGERPDPDLYMLASGVSAPFELTRDRFWTGSSAQLEPLHWKVLWCMLGAGILGVLAAGVYQSLPSGKPDQGGIALGAQDQVFQTPSGPDAGV